MPFTASSVPLTFVAKLGTNPAAQSLYHDHPFIRQFSTSRSFQRATFRRRKFQEWLKGPAGTAFRKPLKGAPANYLSAYNPEGQLNRLQKSGRGDADRQTQREEETESDNQEEVQDLDPENAERSEAESRFRAGRGGMRNTRRPQEMPPPSRRDLAPFPLNTNFISESVLSEEFREMIYLKVVEDKMTVRSVSAELGVSMERVGAVVRMKQMERDWLRIGKPLAVPYSRAVLEMLPQTRYTDPKAPPKIGRDGRPKPAPVHESINDLPVHPRTTQQIFYPVSESRAFTRADAGRAFHPRLKSADERIPHPEMIAIEKFKSQASSPQLAAFKLELVQREQAEELTRANNKLDLERQNLKVYEGQRYVFKFEDVSVDSVGKNGRGRAGIGWRYGMPHEDRKPGQVKIPTSVG